MSELLEEDGEEGTQLTAKTATKLEFEGSLQLPHAQSSVSKIAPNVKDGSNLIAVLQAQRDRYKTRLSQVTLIKRMNEFAVVTLVNVRLN